MITSTSTFSTENGLNYLHQLSSHFAKRVPVEVNGQSVRITLPVCTCDLIASQTAIFAHINADADHINRMEDLFGGWIERCAFRENANLTWHRAMPSKGDQPHVS